MQKLHPMPPLGKILGICPQTKIMYFTIQKHWGRSLKQTQKWPAPVVPVSWRKTLSLNHVPLDLVDSGWTTSRERSCQSLVLISARLMGKQKPASGTHSVVLIGWPWTPVAPGSWGEGYRMRWDPKQHLRDARKITWFFFMAFHTPSTVKTFWGTDTSQGGKETEKCAVSLQLPGS